MSEQNAQLQLIWRTHPGGGVRPDQNYLDFVINEQSLGKLLRVCNMIGCLGWGNPEYEAELIQGLLLTKPLLLETGRAMLYVCPECGDIGCGAITAKIEHSGEYIVWRDFGYENNYDPSTPNLEEYVGIGPFLFNQTEYWQTLTAKYDR